MKEGELLKIIVEKEGYEGQKFADLIDLSRTHLYNLYKKEVIPHEVKEKLKTIGIDIFDVKYLSNKTIPYFDIDATAGAVDIFMEDAAEYVKSYYDIPSFGDCDCIINVFGDSMYPKICAGQMVALKKINDKSVVPFGEPFLVVTKELRTIKLIMPGSKKGVWSLKSVNKDFPDFEVPIDKVLSVYIVKGIISKTGI